MNERICARPECGAALTGRQRLYCSDSCQGRHWKATHRERIAAISAAYLERTRGHCIRCGELRGRTSHKKTGLCRACFRRASEERRNRMVAMYEAGVSLAAMAEELGISVDYVGVELHRIRKAGRIGYRYKAYEAAA